MKPAIAVLAGALFAFGLIIGGMTQPAKVINFLDVGGHWDPSLAFVLGGAIAAYAPLSLFLRRREKTLLGESLDVPDRIEVNPKLVLGATLFGIGWGLGGFCPGPGITSAASMTLAGVIFAAGMGLGFAMYRAASTLASDQ